MAVDTTPKLKVRQSLLAKIETTTGTAEALVADDGDYNIYNVRHSYDIQLQERPGQAGYGKLETITGTRFGAIEFECDLSGSGTTGPPPWASVFLPACGFNVSSGIFTAGYNASQPTITIGDYVDGVKFALAGCAGTVRFPLVSGMPARAMFRFIGKLVVDADVALVTPTAITVLPPRFAGNTLLVAGAYTPYINSLEIDVNNTLEIRPFQGDTTGGRACIITDRKPLISMDPELQLVATRDWLGILLAHTKEAFSCAIGTVANNILTFTSSSAQWTEVPLGERNGLVSRDVKGHFCSDDLVATFT